MPLFFKIISKETKIHNKQTNKLQQRLRTLETEE